MKTISVLLVMLSLGMSTVLWISMNNIYDRAYALGYAESESSLTKEYATKHQLDNEQLYANYTVDFLNRYRLNNKLRPVEHSAILSKVAYDKAKDMFDRHYFQHQTPEGEYIWDTESAGYTANYYGENLAAGFVSNSPAVRASDTVYAWYMSDSHRANILNENYTHVGVGVYERYTVHFFASKKEI